MQHAKERKKLRSFMLLIIAIMLIISSDSAGFSLAVFRLLVICEQQSRYINTQHTLNVKGKLLIK